ncbi:lipoprotein [Hymenobacter ruricola]|uniref:Lipoprotein n=1 Tax=Hymenobacter ruricola TaxID=2791023 RepID=A0ABS0I410_9BACT|nr:lipoprotein [Hymenobacter ruricola]MBF9221663.1 lipoprotein [Hymenobacter ruricola]
MNKSLIVLSAALLGLAGCGQKPADETTAPVASAPATAPAPAATAPAETGVTRAETAPAAPTKPALDTQPGPKGTQVALTKALVRGDILTVELQYSLNPGIDNTPTLYEKIDQINYIDDATSKKYGVLKDQEGSYMATPLYSNTKELRIELSQNSPSIATVKFPAPPATSQTISLTIPEVGSFDGVAVQR